jgi:hypothetical protein
MAADIVTSALSSQVILADAFEKRMPCLALSGLRPVLDFGQKLRLDPDALVRDPLGVGLCRADQRRQSLAESSLHTETVSQG